MKRKIKFELTENEYNELMYAILLARAHCEDIAIEHKNEDNTIYAEFMAQASDFNDLYNKYIDRSNSNDEN